MNSFKVLVVCLVALLSLAAPVGGQDRAAVEAVARAMEAVAEGKWDDAVAAAAEGGQVARDIVEWHRLRAGAGDFAEYLDFLDRRGDWPGLPLMRRVGEASIPSAAAPEAVIAFFGGEAPQTGAGALRLAAAYAALDRSGDAEAEIVRAWRDLAMPRSDEETYLARYGKLLAPHHAARQDMLLWQGAVDAAERLNPRVSRGQRALVDAWGALIENRRGVDARLAAVPKELADTPGLAFARFQWRLNKGRPDDARALMEARSTSAAALGRPAAWAPQRRRMARELMRAGKMDEAYELASHHFLDADDGEAYSDLEWLSGYLALVGLNRPEVAVGHFRHLRRAVDSPISLGRAGYWEGRALEAMGDAEGAARAYAFGAEFQTSFYGQLAAEKAGVEMDPGLAGGEEYPDIHHSEHGESSVLEAALLFQKAGHPLLFTRFTRHLAEILTAEERGALAQLALDLQEPFAALYMAKYAAGGGTVLVRPYFPVTDIVEAAGPVPRELTLAIARRESEFYPFSTSGAGARGLMQIMPATAREMARKIGIEFESDRLITDPKYNARLGNAYLQELMTIYDGYLPFVAAGYNAGPSRPLDWADAFGDPRRSVEAAVDWIEHIPFDETRNYVMRVMESVLVYRARLAGRAVPLRLSAELVGR